MTLDLSYEPGVKVVTGAVSNDGPEDRPAKKIEVSQQIEDLMADQLVSKAKVAVHHSSLADHDCVVKRPAKAQVATAKLFDVLQEPVGATRRNLPGEHLPGDVEGGRLFSQERVVETHRIDNLKTL